jgi:hypothetical protein
MSWQIPTQIEQDIIAGKAQYRTFQTGNGGQSILPVPPNAYVVIFGYDFSPAGGGIGTADFVDTSPKLTPSTLRWFETQQISFYTGTDFFPFIHHVNLNLSAYFSAGFGAYASYSVDNTPISRQVYITSSNDITITHGLILNSQSITQSQIPVTNRTPALLSYGGSGQFVNSQTNYGPNATPIQFMQPSPKDYQAFGFGLLPNAATDQAFASPDPVNGLLDSTAYLASFHIDYANAAACNYFLNLHYAIYTQSIPESRG